MGLFLFYIYDMCEYYVYFIIEPTSNIPFYVGYGKGNRIKQHLYKRELVRKCHKSSKIISILNSGEFPIFKKICENLSFEEANKLEIYYISLFGRIDNNTGILTNHTDGGCGTKNKVLSIETKNKISNSHKGLKHSDKTKEKLSILNRNKLLSDETKELISVNVTGYLNGFYGRKHKNISGIGVNQIDINTGKIVTSFKSITEATRVTKISHIRDVCIGIRKSAGGYLWEYSNSDYVISNNKGGNFKKVRIKQLDRDGSLIQIFNSVSEASDTLSITRSNISLCLIKKKRSAGGFKWDYV